jgi:hypothetical protein
MSSFATNRATMGNLGTSYLRNGQLKLALHWFDIALDASGRPGAAIPVLRKLSVACAAISCFAI